MLIVEIRKQTVLKIKIAKNAQKLPKFDLLKNLLLRCTMRTSLPTLQKGLESLQYIVTEIETGQNTNFKSVFFLAKTSQFVDKFKS